MSTSPSSPPAQARYIHLQRLPPLNHSQLQLFDPEDAWFREVRDPTNGVFLYRTVAKAPDDTATEAVDRITAPDADGTVCYEETCPLTNGSEVLRFRLTPEAIFCIVTNTSLPLQLRYVALRELPSSGMSRPRHAQLFEFASRDPSPSIRYIALCWPPDLGEDIVPIYARALSDPVVDNGHVACGPLVDFFGLQSEAETLLTAPTCGSAPPEYWYLWTYLDVRRVANRLHTICPELITKLDVGAIADLRMPSLAWWKHEEKHNYRHAMRAYRRLLKEYQDQTAEQRRP